MNSVVVDGKEPAITAVCDMQNDDMLLRLHPDDLRQLATTISTAINTQWEHMAELKATLIRTARWPALMRAQTACSYCDVSLSAWKNYNNSRVIPAPYTIEGCVVWKKTDLDLWMEWGFPGRSVFETRLNDKK